MSRSQSFAELSMRGKYRRRIGAFQNGYPGPSISVFFVRRSNSGRVKLAETVTQSVCSGKPYGETTMRFMMLMIPKGYESASPGTVPDAKAVEAMMKYNESLQKAGVLLALDGLHPPSMGARVSFAGGKPKVTDGPFTEAKEVVGGYWMIQVKSKEEAIEWASRCPGSENEVIEVRQVQEFSDFPTDVQEAAAKFPEMQAQAGRPSGT
jgi:hypothetical protein